MRFLIVGVITAAACTTALTPADDLGVTLDLAARDLAVKDLSGEDLTILAGDGPIDVDLAMDLGTSAVPDLATQTITVNDFFFLPATKTIAVNQTIKWSWVGASSHTVTSWNGVSATDDNKFPTSISQSSGTYSHQ